MKVLLIQPPFTILKSETKKCHPPLGLAYLSGILKDDCEIGILDALADGYDREEYIDSKYLRYGLSFEDIRKKILNFSPDIVGISCLFSAQSKNVYDICALIKEIDERIITVLGGAHTSAVPKEVLEDNNIDFVVIGEGELVFKELLKCIDGGKNFQKIESIGFRYNGSIKINNRKSYQKNLDALPFPCWDIFPLGKYFNINNPHGSPAKRIPFLPMMTSRGCPFECIFCSIHNLWGRNYRIRSAENVLLELDYLTKKFNVKEVLFEDDNLTLNKERAKQIFHGIVDRKLDIIWSVPNGVAVHTLDDEILELMKKSGCYAISVGVESGDEYILKNVIRKPITLSMVRPVIDKANKLGMETTVFFVIGFPGETNEQIKNTFRFSEGLKADNINFFFATPLPGTLLLELCQKKDLIKGSISYLNLRSDYPNFSTEFFSTDDLMRIVSRERLRILFLYLLRDPWKFLCKTSNKLLSDPWCFVRFVLRCIMKA